MSRLTPALIFVLALALTGCVAWTLIGPGPFDWHIRQAEAKQGFGEFILLIALLHAALSVRLASTRFRALLLILPLALYLRRHHVDLALLSALAYVEGMLALGALARGATRSPPQAQDQWLRELVAGVALLGLWLWGWQLAGLGQPREQRLLAGLVLVPLLLWRWRRLASVELVRAALLPRPGGERFWIACMFAFVAMLFARTNTVWDWDSLWYGFRPERVLVGEHSVFEPLGFASPVYYFPKFYEVLLLPLAAARDHSFIQGGTILFGACLARLVYLLLGRVQVPQPWRLALCFVAWTIPAFANTHLSAKPDVFVALMLVAMIWFGANVAEGRRGDLRWVFACAGLAVSSKLLAIPYAGVATLATLVAAWRWRGAMPGEREPLAWLALGTATAVGVLVCARTWVVAGVPTIGPEQLVFLWRLLGMEIAYPIGELSWVYRQDFGNLPVIALGWLAWPSLLPLIVIGWPGNVWVFLPLAACLLGRRRERAPRPPWMLWALPLAGLAMLLSIGFSNRGGDGNYFIAPVLLATVLGGAMVAARPAPTGRTASALAVALALFALLHLGYGFVSAAWGVGTRRYDLDFTRSNRDMPSRIGEALRAQKLDGMADYLRRVHGSRLRMAGQLPLGMGYRLPARYEELYDIGITHLGRNSLAEHLSLLSCGGVEALAIPVGGPPEVPFAGSRAVLEWARSLPASQDLYSDARWRLVDVSPLLPPCRSGPGAG